MPSSRFPSDFVPRKSAFGARLVASHDTSLPSALRRLLLLADGRRTLFTLSQLMPDRDVDADLGDLLDRGLVEDANEKATPVPVGNRMEGAELPDGWESASDFMVDRARASIGVSAVDVIQALEQANDPESARQAMSQWYRAMRNSRAGREQADNDRLKAASLLRGTGQGNE